MKAGVKVEVQIEGEKSRIKCELIAVVEEKLLILQMSPLQSLSLGNNVKLTYEGTSIIIRYIQDGSMFGFKSSVIHYLSEPVRLIFIGFPKKIESHDLRKVNRINCYLPASVIIGDHKIEGAVLDLSRTGCFFTTKNAKIENNQILQVDNEISVSFYLPGVSEEITVEGKQKTTKKDKDSIEIGIEFANMSNKVQEKLYGFLSKTDV